MTEIFYLTEETSPTINRESEISKNILQLPFEWKFPLVCIAWWASGWWSCLALKELVSGASLVAQWLRIRLPMQGTRVQALVWEDPTCRVSNWAGEPQLLSLRVWSLCSATREAAIVRGPRTAMKSGPRLPQVQKALAQKRRPNTAKNK